MYRALECLFESIRFTGCIGFIGFHSVVFLSIRLLCVCWVYIGFEEDRLQNGPHDQPFRLGRCAVLESRGFRGSRGLGFRVSGFRGLGFRGLGV